MHSFAFLLVASAALVMASPIPVQSEYIQSNPALSAGYGTPVPGTTAPSSFESSYFELARPLPGRREFDKLDGQSLARDKPGRREHENDEQSLARAKPGRREFENDGQSLARAEPGRKEFEIDGQDLARNKPSRRLSDGPEDATIG